MSTTLQLIGGIFELIGLIFAAIGFHKTWSEHSTGEDFWGPVKRSLPDALKRVQRFIRQLLHHPEQHTIEVHAGDAAMSADSVMVARGWAGLPDAVTRPREFAAAVEERLDRLYLSTQDMQRALDEERTTRAADDQRLQTDFQAQVRQVTDLSRNVAVGGLRLQVSGWLFLLIGLIISTVANVLQGGGS